MSVNWGKSSFQEFSPRKSVFKVKTVVVVDAVAAPVAVVVAAVVDVVIIVVVVVFDAPFAVFEIVVVVVNVRMTHLMWFWFVKMHINSDSEYWIC